MACATVLKALVLAGLGSRRAMAEAIKQGRVYMNGIPVDSFKQELSSELDTITLDGRSLKLRREGYTYLMLNKPTGVLSTTQDDRGRRTVIDLLPSKYKDINLYIVGRLDLDSNGLLILTNDGTLTYRLTHPRFEKEKEYVVKLDYELRGDDKASFEQGLELEDGLTHPTKIRKSISETNTYYVILHEGRKRQLRRMFASLGYQVTDLKRIRLGNVLLGELPEGKTRCLTEEEISVLRSYSALA